MSLAHIEPTPATSRADLLRYAGAVEQASEHAVATAISTAARAELISTTQLTPATRNPRATSAPAVTPVTSALPSADRFRALPGLGASAVVEGHEVIVGRAKLLADRGLTVPADLTEASQAWEADGCTMVLVAWDGEVRGALAVTDTVKPSAAPAVAALRALGLHPVLLTGDNEATARAVAAAVGIDEVIAETLPDGKAAVITSLQARGHAVAMVGDGVNDAPALAAATIGLAVGSGTDVAMSAADLILLRDDLTVAADAIRLSRATFRTIRRNLVWAFGYNVAALPLAALGFLNPIVASAAMTLSSVFVVWNSLRLRRFEAAAK
jgi:cation transport ATPase